MWPIGIDISKSMLAEDASFPEKGRHPSTVRNRLNRAREIALDILSRLEGERVAVYMFSDTGIELVPPTRDYGLCRYMVTHVNDAGIAVPGSDLARALDTGIDLLLNAGIQDPDQAKVVVLLSDGEDTGSDASAIHAASARAKEKRIVVHTIGVGGENDHLIPLRSPDGSHILSYYTDDDGGYLQTRIVDDTLRTMADRTGGTYERSGGPDTIDRLMAGILKTAHSAEATRHRELVRVSLSPACLMVGLLAFAGGVIQSIMIRTFKV